MQREVVLTTPRTVVTTWLPSDADDLHLIHSDAETMRYVRHGRPESRRETNDLIASYIDEHAIRGWTKWRVAASDGSMLGRAGFGGTDSERQLAFLIRRDDWGRGLASEVAAALVEWHLANAPASSLSAIVAVPNTASVRILERLNLEELDRVIYQGTPCRSFLLVKGRPIRDR